MTNMLRVKMKWTNFTGAPGYSQFHFRDFGDPWVPTLANANTLITHVDTFAGALMSVLLNGVTLQVEGEVEEIEDTDGSLVNVFSGTTPAARVSSNTAGPYSAAVGAVINWRTGVTRNGRRMRGRTFIVPMLGITLENNGTLTSTVISTLNSAATNLRANTTAGDLGVYGRPSGPAATDGTWALITGSNVPDMSAVLRSRRD